jgi:type II secretory pathway component GspD/PulD (secretin)
MYTILSGINAGWRLLRGGPRSPVAGDPGNGTPGLLPRRESRGGIFCPSINSLLSFFVVVAFLVCSTSCRTPAVAAKPKANAELAAAEAHLVAGRYTDALNACIDMARTNPLTPGLPELQNRVMTKLTEVRAREAALAAAQAHSRSEVDVDTRKRIPSSYGLDRFVEGQTNSLRSLPNSMEQILRKPVSIHLDGVGLKDFIMAVAASDNINIITDGAIGEGSLTLHAEKVPLVEILDYVSRNLGVTFFVGENIIWATASAPAEAGPPLETRIYRLRKGLSGDELESGEADIVKIIGQFVPPGTGAQLLFNRKAHVLIAKNTRENLHKIEALIDTLDVCPPQVLIEARFMTLGVNDLRELGIDWIIDSPIGVTTETVLRNGTPVRADRTQIAGRSGAGGPSIGFPHLENDQYGLNFTYQGLLTDPMFRAVVHAIEMSGRSRTLSVPRVTTVNNRPAMIRIGQDFRYFDEYDVQSIPSQNSNQGSTTYMSVLVPRGAPKLEKLGIELNVTPSVGADARTITLRTMPKITEFVRYEYYQTANDTAGNNVNNANTGTTSTNGVAGMVKLPIFSTREIDTELIVQSGETIVMGGLVSSAEGKTESKVPFLSSIPLVGRLFRTDTVSQKQENLLIFVTATILSDRGENLLPLNTVGEALGKDAGGAAPVLPKTPETTPSLPQTEPSAGPVTQQGASTTTPATPLVAPAPLPPAATP